VTGMPVHDHTPNIARITNRPAQPASTQVASGEQTRVYVYCVAPGKCWPDQETSLDVYGVGKHKARVRIIHAGDLTALVSDVAQEEEPYLLSRDNLLAHEHVIEQAMARSDVLPMQFGRIAASDREVSATLLGPQQQRLRALLEFVRGKVEFSLKVLWHRQRLFEEIVAEDAEIRHLRDVMGSTGFSERLVLGQLVEETMLSKRECEASRILRQLQPHAVDVRLHAAPSDMMVLNAALLVQRAQIDEFDQQVNRLAAQDANRLIYRFAGPLPPYSFVLAPETTDISETSET